MKTRGKTLAVLLLLLSLIAAQRIPGVSATGALLISPSVVQLLPKAALFSILVNVSNIDPLYGWRIQVVVSDASTINATGFSVIGDLVDNPPGSGTELRHCVNGAGKGCCLNNVGQCNTVEGADGPGVVSSDYFNSQSAGGSGWLLNITYQVVGVSTYSRITIQNDLLTGGTANVAHTTHGGSYGIAPDIDVASAPSSITVPTSGSNTSTITLIGLHGFKGNVNVAAISPGSGISAVVFPNQTSLAVGGCNCSLVTLTVSASSTTPETLYSITLNVTSSIRSPILFQLSISIYRPDFSLYASPSDLYTHQSSSNSATVFVKSLKHFQGTVEVQVQSPAGTTAWFVQTNNASVNLTIAQNGITTATLKITTQPSPIRFRDEFTLTASGGSITHSFTVVAEPPTGDFSISTNPTYASVQAGKTEVITVGITSLDYYIGTIYLLGTSPSGISISFNPGSFYLDTSQTVFSTLTITTNSTTDSGNHTVTLAILGEFGANQLSHESVLTIAVTPPPPISPVSSVRTFLGLQEPAFFGLIIGLITALAVLGVIEGRRAKRPQRSSILEG